MKRLLSLEQSESRENLVILKQPRDIVLDVGSAVVSGGLVASVVVLADVVGPTVVVSSEIKTSSVVDFLLSQ